MILYYGFVIERDFVVLSSKVRMVPFETRKFFNVSLSDTIIVDYVKFRSLPAGAPFPYITERFVIGLMRRIGRSDKPSLQGVFVVDQGCIRSKLTPGKVS